MFLAHTNVTLLVLIIFSLNFGAFLEFRENPEIKDGESKIYSRIVTLLTVKDVKICLFLKTISNLLQIKHRQGKDKWTAADIETPNVY